MAKNRWGDPFISNTGSVYHPEINPDGLPKQDFYRRRPRSRNPCAYLRP